MIGETCQQCGQKNLTWFVDSVLWNRVMRHPSGREVDERYGIVCPQCFDATAEALGLTRAVWELRLDHGFFVVPKQWATVTTPAHSLLHDGLLWHFVEGHSDEKWTCGDWTVWGYVEDGEWFIRTKNGAVMPDTMPTTREAAMTHVASLIDSARPRGVGA